MCKPKLTNQLKKIQSAVGCFRSICALADALLLLLLLASFRVLKLKIKLDSTLGDPIACLELM